MTGAGVILAGGMRSHQENYAAAFLAAGCRLLAVGIAPGLDADEVARHAELAAALKLPAMPLEEALGLPGASIASVCVDVRHRARVAVLCAEAGLALYLDKPLAGSADEATAIAAAVRRAGVPSQIFSHVTAPWAVAARRAIADGRIGRVIAVHADMMMAKGIPAELQGRPRVEAAHPDDFPRDIAKRELSDMGPYPVSLVAWLLGTRARTVNAVTANHFFAEHQSRDVEDYAAMLVDFEGGVTASITCGRTGWQSWRRPYLSRVIIVGDRDTLTFDSEPLDLVLTSGRGIEPPPRHATDPMGMWLSTRQGTAPLAAETRMALAADGAHDVAAFVEGLAVGKLPGISADEAAHHCAIIAAAYRSAAEGWQVEV
ncbi:MAG: Gfo/Idh/MocA family oxidoreductase [Hyphomicrobiales bacterium]|nr:MAG: Gfo/Idh/MocA family oxidoreductase [Hyphomicrobiales bacterium]